MQKFSILDQFPNLVQGFSERSEGNMSFRWGDLEIVARSRQELARQAGFDPAKVIQFRLAHATGTIVVSSRDAGPLASSDKTLKDIDSAVTNMPGVTLFLLTGDCLPIVFYDPQKQVIGIAHAGWKGVMGKIFLKTLLTMHSQFESSVKDVYVGIGPAVCKVCQKTKDPDYFSKYPEWKNYSFIDNDGVGHTDLVGFTLDQLKDSGIKTDHMQAVNICTNDNRDQFFTHKTATRQLPEGRFATFICLKE